MWIYEQPDWPRFRWNQDLLLQPLAHLRHRQGYLLGLMAGLGLDFSQAANLSTLTEETVKSWAIEGQTLDAEAVKSSLARRLGMPHPPALSPDRSIEGITAMMLDATQNAAAPLTVDRLWSWHAALFPTGYSGLRAIEVGQWRNDESGPMQVVSGPIGRETLHYQAPEATELPLAMTQFLTWFNQPPHDLDPILQAGIAHFWFLTLHPFEDGNGRIARALTELALARADGSPLRFYSLSAQIEEERKQYYRILEQQQRGSLDLTPWLQWFLGCCDRALNRAETIVTTLRYKATLWQKLAQSPLNSRQRKILNRLLEDFKGNLTTSKYAKLSKCSTDTALRDIQAILSYGALIQNPAKGRSTSYRLPTEEELESNSLSHDDKRC
jgi:Fic family protein